MSSGLIIRIPKDSVFLNFKYISEEDTSHLLSLRKTEDIRRFMGDKLLGYWDKFGLKKGQEEILKDYYSLVLGCSRSEDMSELRTGTLLSIMHEVMYEALLKRQSVGELYIQFRELLIQHSIDHPPVNVPIFTLQQVKTITNLFVEDIYKKYNFYDVALNTKLLVELKTKENMFISLPRLPEITEDFVEINPEEIPDLAQYLPIKEEVKEGRMGGGASEEDIDKILQKGIDQIELEMEARMNDQDEKFIDALK